MTDTIETHRRVVVVDEGEHSKVIADGPSPDIRLDPARPGYSLSRMWVSGAPPVRLAGLRESLQLANTLEPLPGGSTCYMVTFPPDSAFRGNIGSKEVEAWFAKIGSPSASTYSTKSSHPYMQKTRTLDFCLVLEGEITLVLDTEEVTLHAGDIVVQRGTNHAWSNRSEQPCVIAFSVHDARL
jgi:mannose-6-phosphate isomerase-like protein (cupin superfamily)